LKIERVFCKVGAGRWVLVLDVSFQELSEVEVEVEIDVTDIRDIVGGFRRVGLPLIEATCRRLYVLVVPKNAFR